MALRIPISTLSWFSIGHIVCDLKKVRVDNNYWLRIASLYLEWNILFTKPIGSYL